MCRGAKDEQVSITGTLIIQMIVFLILVGFTMKFVWPPIATALDERARKIAEGLAAADKAKSELSAANQRVESELARTRQETAALLADAERRAQAIVEEAKGRATEEGNKIIAAARVEAESRSQSGDAGRREEGQRQVRYPCQPRAGYRWEHCRRSAT